MLVKRHVAEPFGNEEHLLMKGPPVVERKITQTQKGNQEPGRPLGLESHDDHDASDKGNDGNNCPGDAEFTIEDKGDKEEDEENATSQLLGFRSCFFSFKAVPHLQIHSLVIC